MPSESSQRLEDAREPRDVRAEVRCELVIIFGLCVMREQTDELDGWFC
jgi:hypothetical protein